MVGTNSGGGRMTTNPFYLSPAWQHKRKQILQRDHHECVYCKAKGKHSRAVIVHHVKHLDEYPELALSDYYTDEHGVQHRQLVSVCRDCHETVCHPERMRRTYKKPLTEERW
jgi:5-methylcytosine-specific restriction endonuclease McrA